MPDERQAKQLEQQVGPLLLRMIGLYDVPLAFVFRGAPQYEFGLQLPGELIETNGMVRERSNALEVRGRTDVPRRLRDEGAEPRLRS